MRNRGVTPHVARRTHSAIDGRTTRHASYKGEPEGTQEGGGGVRVDEDSGRITEDTVPGSREDGAGWVLCGYGLQPGADGEPGGV